MYEIKDKLQEKKKKKLGVGSGKGLLTLILSGTHAICGLVDQRLLKLQSCLKSA